MSRPGPSSGASGNGRLRSRLEAISRRDPATLPDLDAIAFSALSAHHFSNEGPPGPPGSGRILTTADFPDDDAQRFQQLFALWVCHGAALGRAGQPIYLELALQGDTAEASTRSVATGDASLVRSFFAEARAPGDKGWRPFVDGLGPDRWAQLSPVYVLSEVSHPRGTLPHAIIKNSAGRIALAIMLWGIQAPRICQHCASQFLRRPTSSNEHALSPFHACRVLPGVAQGCYANCVFEGRTDCVYEYLGGYISTDPRGSRPADVRLDGVGARAALPHIGPETAPRITDKLTRLDQGPAQRRQAIQEARERIAHIQANA